ncbi:asparagine synthase-related protein [Streptomyces yaizuensis]|uniref:asparagine synthase (glutamine-hydrolyzing) n=1 Tax=Streptomyces yaizuensis TaxID=2989713 RepID=A0ABQ5NQS0_9ACTN|nr:asparagine synthase-related protein [Streptomyces sp. YSPA8]GLF92729.1 asparagine synthetase B family protein [Streptomyces sp. YSPA8]
MSAPAAGTARPRRDTRPPAARSAAPSLRLVRTPDGVRAAGAHEARLGHAVGGHDLDDPAVPEGVFASWRWDGGRLLVRTDRYGMFPLFYRAGAGSIALSTRVEELLTPGEDAEPDHDALAVFVRLGFFLAEDTCFTGIRALPPAATLTWTPAAGVRIDAGERGPRGTVDTDRERAVDGFVELFRAAVARRLPPAPYLLPLSGGRDSRHILLELCRQGVPPKLCVSGAKFPPDPGADAEVAAALARRLGLAHRTLTPRRSQFRAELTANTAQSMTTLDGAWTLPLLAYLGRHSPVTYDGIGGGELAQNPSIGLIRDLPRELSAPAALPELADTLLRAAGRTGPHIDWLLGPRHAALWSQERARARLVAELARHRDAAFPLGSFFFWNRTRRSIAMAPYALAPASTVVHAPYLDHALFDHLSTVPHRHLIDGDFHDRALARAYPEHDGFPFAAAVPGRHGAALARHRLAYLGRLYGHALAAEPRWLRAGEGMLGRLLAAGRGPGGPVRVSRLLPLTLYLLQLESLATGRTT